MREAGRVHVEARGRGGGIKAYDALADVGVFEEFEDHFVNALLELLVAEHLLRLLFSELTLQTKHDKTCI